MSAFATCPSPLRSRPRAGLFSMLLAVVVALAAACRSTSRAPVGPLLPFHVALIPTAIQDTSVLATALSEGDFVEPSGAEPDDDMRLALSTSAVTRALARELEHVFVRATLLELPSDADGFAELSRREREAFWQARARAVGANLLVRTRLSVDPEIHGSRNEKFWLNLPLFFLGGPMCYFVGDRSYEAAARLQAEFFEITEEHDALADFSILAIPLYAQFRGTDLNFLHRADGVGAYALSLLVPSGLLSAKSDEVEEEVAERLARRLGEELADEVRAQRPQFEQNVALGAFRLDSERARFEPGADGRVHVQVPVVELAEGTSLHRAEVFDGSTCLASQDFAAAPEPALVRVVFASTPDVRYLTIRISDDRACVRGYTLRVPVEAEVR